MTMPMARAEVKTLPKPAADDSAPGTKSVEEVLDTIVRDSRDRPQQFVDEIVARGGGE